MNNKEYNIFEEELEMLRNQYVTDVAYKVVEEELANQKVELVNPSNELIERLTDKATKEILNDGIVELDDARKVFISEMVEGAIDNIF